MYFINEMLYLYKYDLRARFFPLKAALPTLTPFRRTRWFNPGFVESLSRHSHTPFGNVVVSVLVIVILVRVNWSGVRMSSSPVSCDEGA